MGNVHAAAEKTKFEKDYCNLVNDKFRNDTYPHDKFDESCYLYLYKPKEHPSNYKYYTWCDLNYTQSSSPNSCQQNYAQYEYCYCNRNVTSKQDSDKYHQCSCHNYQDSYDYVKIPNTYNDYSKCKQTINRCCKNIPDGWDNYNKYSCTGHSRIIPYKSEQQYQCQKKFTPTKEVEIFPYAGMKHEYCSKKNMYFDNKSCQISDKQFCKFNLISDPCSDDLVLRYATSCNLKENKTVDGDCMLTGTSDENCFCTKNNNVTAPVANNRYLDCVCYPQNQVHDTIFITNCRNRRCKCPKWTYKNCTITDKDNHLSFDGDCDTKKTRKCMQFEQYVKCGDDLKNILNCTIIEDDPVDFLNAAYTEPPTSSPLTTTPSIFGSVDVQKQLQDNRLSPQNANIAPVYSNSGNSASTALIGLLCIIGGALGAAFYYKRKTESEDKMEILEEDTNTQEANEHTNPVA